jgi:hypothetical protein
MKEYEHATINKPETKPAHDEVAKKAYGTYLKEGRSQGRDAQNRLEAESKTPPRFPWLSTSDRCAERSAHYLYREVSQAGQGRAKIVAK